MYVDNHVENDVCRNNFVDRWKSREIPLNFSIQFASNDIRQTF